MTKLFKKSKNGKKYYSYLDNNVSSDNYHQQGGIVPLFLPFALTAGLGATAAGVGTTAAGVGAAAAAGVGAAAAAGVGTTAAGLGATAAGVGAAAAPGVAPIVTAAAPAVVGTTGVGAVGIGTVGALTHGVEQGTQQVLQYGLDGATNVINNIPEGVFKINPITPNPHGLIHSGNTNVPLHPQGFGNVINQGVDEFVRNTSPQVLERRVSANVAAEIGAGILDEDENNVFKEAYNNVKNWLTSNNIPEPLQ